MVDYQEQANVSSGTGSPGQSRTKGRKMVVVVVTEQNRTDKGVYNNQHKQCVTFGHGSAILSLQNLVADSTAQDWMARCH